MEEVSYVIITPYTIIRSRTGGVLARLLPRLQDLVLEGARMVAFDEETTKAYAESMLRFKNESVPKSAELLHDYIINNFMPTNGRPHRALMLFFRGENAVRRLSDIVGALMPERRGIESITGETIRDTYADIIWDSPDKNFVTYFEPAVLAPRSREAANYNLKIFADFLENQPNLVRNIVYPNPSLIERTLVIIKPDNWKYASSRPGTIIDMFSRTGLRIIGCKLYQMSVNEALEFYGPVKEALRSKLAPGMAEKGKDLLERKFGIKIPESKMQQLVESFGYSFSDDQFYKIIEFMTGIRPEDCATDDMDNPGTVKCMVLVYEGENAVERIREVLGPTDPAKAPGGTIRRDFGHDVMVNTAHASDSTDNAIREMGIVKIENNEIGKIIKKYLK
ncbi:MAG: nucleoside-diphosphate kinase [Spirochaetales bacterium]|nr:nucleoside-diphosphate kinase [Spirochaetales bacterium]